MPAPSNHIIHGLSVGVTVNTPTTIPVMISMGTWYLDLNVYTMLPNVHQQNKIHLDNLDRAGQRSIEPQKLQKGADLYSAVQLSVMPVTAL